MRWNVLARLAGLALVAGCSTGFDRAGLEQSIREGSPVYVSEARSVEEIESLRAQVSLPLRLAVAPPLAHGRYHQDTWSPRETAEIDSWLEPLAEAGIVSELLILPTLLTAPCAVVRQSCGLATTRAAAARVQADALLIVNVATDVDDYMNALGILNLTVIGMWIAPAHRRDALTIVEGVMLDNRNEYLYAFARGEGTASVVRPLVYSASESSVRRSRLGALEAFGDEFVRRASQLKVSDQP